MSRTFRRVYAFINRSVGLFAVSPTVLISSKDCLEI
uniref:Uncharacterized protein n=1 Tax=Phage sp. ct17O1 TaxID=2825789 RepID=A0A8S5PLK9_9VIRU|nr:MAG TPA: hypothetical protein [Phage sp. ct17O1]DAH08482.1 MAG TPA: hypothetical protein [Bacteriophage sp.]DAN36680.1 MAG TPA: hypothetical protein [Caudoviricetes sp.]DAR11613.1 MAG TPA: hypothetical protein [Caudoviricetes sp.]